MVAKRQTPLFLASAMSSKAPPEPRACFCSLSGVSLPSLHFWLDTNKNATNKSSVISATFLRGEPVIAVLFYIYIYIFSTEAGPAGVPPRGSVHGAVGAELGGGLRSLAGSSLGASNLRFFSVGDPVLVRVHQGPRTRRRAAGQLPVFWALSRGFHVAQIGLSIHENTQAMALGLSPGQLLKGILLLDA